MRSYFSLNNKITVGKKETQFYEYKVYHKYHNVVFVVVVFTLKAVPVSTQYFVTSVLVQLTRTPSVVTG